MVKRRIRAKVKRRIKAVEDRRGGATPWWSLPGGQEPSWPRPLKHWTVYELAALALKEIHDYADAWERGENYQPSPAAVWLYGEAWHEFRWQRYRIARRNFGHGSPPENWHAFAEEEHRRLGPLDWDSLGVADYVEGGDSGSGA